MRRDDPFAAAPIDEEALHLAPPALAGEAQDQLRQSLLACQRELALQAAELQRVRQALSASSDRDFALFHLAPVSYLLVDAAGIVVDANLTVLDLLRLTIAELRGQPLGGCVAPEDHPVLAAHLSIARRAQGREHCELLFQPRGGVTFPGFLESRALPSGADRQPLLLVAILDLSERKRAEQERAALMARLRQSQRLAAIGRQVGGVAHDMNNVLGAIMGLASLLPDELKAADCAKCGRLSTVRQGIEQILAASRRGRDLTQDLLGVARKDAWRSETLSLNALVVEVTDLLRRTQGKHVEIRLALAAEDPCVDGDSTQLHRVLMNLCLNALDAMGGHGVLTVTTGVKDLGAEVDDLAARARLAPGRYAVLEVADTGPGMSPEVLARAFEPFFTTKRLGQGTGLGLAMVLARVRDHRGAVALRCREGTVATVYLPLVTSALGGGGRAASGEPRALPAASQTLAGASSATAEAPSPSTVLLVDDEQLIRSAGRRLLARLGFAALMAETGEEALALYAQRRGEIALVLLDLSMPGMDGVETLQRLRQIDPGLKVLLCSGFSHERVPAELLTSRSTGFLRKPFALDDLSESIQALRAAR